MKKLLAYCLLLCWLSTVMLYAQSGNDVVRLKNGGVVRGTIIEYLPADHLTIRSDAQNTLTFAAADIATVEQQNSHQRSPISPRNKGYYHLTQGGISIGNSTTNWQNDPVNGSLQTINGYKFNPYLAVGVGVGIDWYTLSRVYPIFADVRGSLLPKSSVTPIYFAQAGYGFGGSRSDYRWLADYTAHGGFMASTGVGMQVYINNRTAWLVELGYKMQQVRDRYTDAWSTSTHDRNQLYRRLVVRTGITF